MKGRQFGAADPLTLYLLALTLVALGSKTTLSWADLKTGPSDSREVLTLLTCFATGCGTQLAYLLSKVGEGGGHPWQRWIGETVLGGVSAYMASVAYLRYGPPTDPPTLVVIAAIGGFLGQRLLIAAGEAMLQVLRSKTGAKPGGDKDGV